MLLLFRVLNSLSRNWAALSRRSRVRSAMPFIN